MKLGPTIPVLRMFDEERAAEFYLGFLGFSKEWEHRFGPELPLYMQISSGGCLLHLSGHHGDCCPGGAVRIACADVKGFSTALIAKAYKHARPGYERTEWNTLEMTVADPFGNKLIFYQSLEEKAD